MKVGAEFRALLDSMLQIERDNNTVDEIVVSHAIMDALKAQGPLGFIAETDETFISGIRIKASSLVKGAAFFSNGKLLKVIL